MRRRRRRHGRRSGAAATDDSGNIETPGAGVTVTVGAGPARARARSGRRTATPGGDRPGHRRGRARREVPRRDQTASSPASASTRRATNTGTHVGTPVDRRPARCWPRSPSPARRASGWQQVTFATPVAVTANTTYVASYFAPVGHYAAATAYFATAADDRGPLPALAERRRRRQRRLPRTAAPRRSRTSTYNSENYWVDVVFTRTPRRHHHADGHRPDARRRAPPASPSGTDADGDVQRAGAAGSTIGFTLRDPANDLVAGTRRLRRGDAHRHASPRRRALAPSTTYTATLSGADGHRRQRDGPGDLVVHHRGRGHHQADGHRRTPAAGATGVPVGATRRPPSFSEAGAAGDHQAFELRDPSDSPGPGDDRLQRGTRTATLTPNGGAGGLDDLHRDAQRRDGRRRQRDGPGDLVVHHRGPGHHQADGHEPDPGAGRDRRARWARRRRRCSASR